MSQDWVVEMLGPAGAVAIAAVALKHGWAMMSRNISEPTAVDPAGPSRCPACGSYLTEWVADDATPEHLVLTLRCYDCKRPPQDRNRTGP